MEFNFNLRVIFKKMDWKKVGIGAGILAVPVTVIGILRSRRRG